MALFTFFCRPEFVDENNTYYCKPIWRDRRIDWVIIYTDCHVTVIYFKIFEWGNSKVAFIFKFFISSLRLARTAMRSCEIKVLKLVIEAI